MTHINRRKALSIVAAAPAAVALSPTAFASVGEDAEPGELAALVRRYFAEVDAFNNDPRIADDFESDKLAAATYERTLRKIVRTPARTADDAVAAIDCLLKDSDGCMVETDEDSVHGALIRTVRTYLAGRVA